MWNVTRALSTWSRLILLSFFLIFFGPTPVAGQADKAPRTVFKLKQEHLIGITKGEEVSTLSLMSLASGSNNDRSISHLKDLKLKRVFPHAGKFEARHRDFGLHLWFYLESDDSNNFQQAKKAFLGMTELFEFVEEAPVMERQAITSHPIQDSLFNRQWNFYNKGQTGGRAGADISLINALKLEKGSKEVILSIHDSGIDSLDQDLVANLWTNEGEIPGNGIDDDNNGYIDDIHGWNFALNNNDLWARHWHGPSIGGIIAGKANKKGVIGIAGGDTADNGIRVMICRTDSDFAGLDVINPAASIVYAADNGSVISSNSWNSFGRSSTILNALNYYASVSGNELIDQGLIVFSAGNHASSFLRYEKEAPNVVMVASTDHNDQASTFTNFGDWVDFSAPGEDIMSNDLNGGYRLVSGTSFSAPHVAGLAALVLSKYGGSGYTRTELVQRLKDSSDPIDDLNNSRYKGRLGAGRINAFRALLDDDITPPDRVTNLWVQEAHAFWIDLGLKTPFDNTIAPFAYEVGVRNKTDKTDSLYRIEVMFPDEGDSLLFRLEGLEEGKDYALSVKAIDYFDLESGQSDSLFFTSLQAPRLEVASFPANHDFDRLSEYSTGLTFENTGGSNLAWELFEKDSSLKFDGLRVSMTSDNYDEVADYIQKGGGESSNLDSDFGVSDLLKTHLIVIDDRIEHFDSEQLNYLLEWVDRGGNLMLGVDGNGTTRANELLAQLDIELITYPQPNYTRLKELKPTHEIIEGPNTIIDLYLYFYRAYLQVGNSSKAEVVLKDEFGNPHIIVQDYGKGKMIIAANQFFQDFQLFQDDNFNLMRNAVERVASEFLVKPDQSQGVLIPGEVVNIDVKFNHNLGPEYKDSLELHTNDRNQPILKLPYRLRINGKGRLKGSKNNVLYDTVHVGYTALQHIDISNVGSDSLSINGAISGSIFSLDQASHKLAPGETVQYEISFSPKASLALSGYTQSAVIHRNLNNSIKRHWSITS